jgi:hypothetical protein
MSPFWCPEFCGDSKIFGKIVNPFIKQQFQKEEQNLHCHEPHLFEVVNDKIESSLRNNIY